MTSNKQQANVQNQDVKQIQVYDSDKTAEEIAQIRAKYNIESLPFDFSGEDITWQDFGYTTVPLSIHPTFKAGQIQYSKNTRFKAIFKNGQYQDMVSRSYAFYPHESVNEIVIDLAKKMDFSIKKVYNSHAGKAQYWQILSNNQRRLKVKGSHDNDDELGVGAIIRNGIGTTYVALGADLFTYRLVCANGAIARGQDLGSVALAHIGKIDDLKKRFVQGLELIFEKSKQLVTYYEQATKINVNKRIAERMAKRCPEKYLPGFIEVETIPVGDGKTRQEVTLTDRNVDLWQAFNSSTAKLWHSDTAGFSTKRYHEIVLHRILVSEVNKKRNPNPE